MRDSVGNLLKWFRQTVEKAEEAGLQHRPDLKVCNFIDPDASGGARCTPKGPFTRYVGTMDLRTGSVDASPLDVTLIGVIRQFIARGVFRPTRSCFNKYARGMAP